MNERTYVGKETVVEIGRGHIRVYSAATGALLYELRMPGVPCAS